MENLRRSLTYEGGCHCGAIRFRAIVTQQQGNRIQFLTIDEN
jgi:hypothetical protein